MSLIREGEAHIATRARLMLLLGEQLITDEVAAVSELVKNSYDADAERVKVTLSNVSDSKIGQIRVQDDGNGMSLETVLKNWLELGTLAKARRPNQKVRLSENKKRIFLGEKGLGRLAVHKLGYVTTIVTRRKGEDVETKLTIDWTVFDQEGFLDKIPIRWEVTEPEVFKDRSNGTLIEIKKLRRKWTEAMMKQVKASILALISPFQKIQDFSIDVAIDDENAPIVTIPNMLDLTRNATYTFTGEVNNQGQLSYNYRFVRKDLGLEREESKSIDIKDPTVFSPDREPTCGPFKIELYSWDAHSSDLKAVFGETSIYRKMIRPNGGVKVFRDGFRVYPYGKPDNDWLGMDDRRVRAFELRLSRNQVICAIEISSKSNPYLIDKTDREGLIANQAFTDFFALILGAITQCEKERFIDRRELKELTGRGRVADKKKAIFTRNLAALSKMVWKEGNLPGESKIAFDDLIKESRDSIEEILKEKEQPLLVAASIGITYLMPTHEIKRHIDEAAKILGRMRKKGEMDNEKITSAINHIREAGLITNGLARLSTKSEESIFRPRKAAEDAFFYMKYKFERTHIRCNIEGPSSLKAKGKENLIVMLLLNFLDNSFYWLLKKKPDERQIKIIVSEYEGAPSIIVSDSGPGFEENDLDILTLPFFTTKPDGMGLGLYIAERIAKMNGGNLRLLDVDAMPGLLPGANIAVKLRKAGRK